VLNERVFMDPLKIRFLEVCANFIILNSNSDVCYDWNVVSCSKPRSGHFCISILLAENVRICTFN
jgi:hypothetical protein